MSTASMPTLGRFELRRLLGRGTQGEVWLAHDPRLQRDVALKRLRQGALDPQVLERWLGEARAVGRLSHPNIVPLFEADLEGEQPFLVFEFVQGQTLAQRLRRDGPMGEVDAIQMMLGVLDGMRHAHAAGVIHRDLKPANVMVEPTGRPRVMDFGLAVVGRAALPQADGLSGTIGYMAPEAVHGAAPQPTVDVFSAGLLFYELLTGQPAIKASDPRQAVYQLSQADLALPDSLRISPRVRATLQRALERDPLQRFDDAGAMHDALAACVPGPASPQTTAAQHATLEFLLRRMQHKGDFPALSDAVRRIQKLTQSDDENLSSLANEILKDVALTNKMIRLVNSSYYRRPGSGAISTISRAIALIGLAGIRNLALSLVLMEHMQDKQHAAALREEFLRGLMTGLLAHEMCPVARDAEEAFICGMFQNLGRMLTQFYFPEEAEQIRRSLPGAPRTPGEVSAPRTTLAQEESAARAVLGLSYQELAIGVGRTWGLPDGLLKSMRRIPDEARMDTAVHAEDRLRTLASAANEWAQVLSSTEPAQEAELQRRRIELTQRYAKALEWNANTLTEVTTRAQAELREWTQNLQVPVQPGTAGARLTGSDSATSTLTASMTRANALGTLTHATALMPPPGAGGPAAPLNDGFAAGMLAAGIADISNTLVDDFKLHEVMRMILETMFRALEFQRVVFCLRDMRTGLLTGRIALGQDSATVARHFVINPGATGDLLATVCSKGLDTLIGDVRAGTTAQRLPPWFHPHLGAPTFLLLPLLLKGAPIGLIYADKAEAGAIVLTEREMALLRTLRNQALMALRPRSG